MVVRTPIEESDLTSRELEVLDLLSYGHSEQTVANKLKISRDTVHTHAQHIKEKFRVDTNHASVAKAFMDGLIF